MASRALIVPAFALAILLAVPAAQAALVITITAPATGPEVLVGESTSVDFAVSFATAGNIVCPTDGSFTVTLVAGKTDDALGLSGATTPDSLTFTIPQGLHSDSAGTAFTSAEQQGSLSFAVDKDKLPPGHASHTLSIVADYDGATIAQCQGDLGATSSSVDVNFPIKFPPALVQNPPAGGTPTTPTTPAGMGSEEDAPKESPAPGAFLLVFVGLAALALRRRT